MVDHATDIGSSSVLRCIVVTPEETVVDGEASFVALPLYDGEIGIALNHSPLIGRLGFGEMRIRQNGATTRYYVDGGFVQVADNVVSVLTNRAVPSTAIDGGAAKSLYDAALSREATGDEQIALRQRALTQARAQMRIARRLK
jgi:F-type H+-transporting ATPase subunit epsilon